MKPGWIVPLLVSAGLWAGGAQGQELMAEDGVIDLTPMLNAMPGTDTQVQTPEPEQSEPAAVAPAPAATPTPSPATDGISPALPAYDRASQRGASAANPVEATGQQLPETILLPFVTQPFQRVLRISGEGGSARLSVQIENPALARELRLSLRSSVNLLPDQSALTFFLNGVEIERLEPDFFDGFETVALPSDALVPGANELIIRADHTHRIFCGPEASFQVWTEIDLGNSGLVVPRAALSGGAQGIREALAAQIVSAGEVTIESIGEVPPALLSELGQRMRALVPGAAPLLTVRSPYAPVTEGQPLSLARIAIVPSQEPVAELREGAGGALVLVLGGPLDVSMLDTWLPAPQPAADLPVLTPAQSISLADMGQEEGVSFESRYARSDIRFSLPEDWLLSASQKAEIDLSYGYIEGLPEGSLLLIKVNDQTVRLLPLFGRGGETLPRLPVGLPARLLSAGANELSFEAIVPGDPPDLPCTRLGGPYVTIDPSTALVVPTSPAMDYPSVSDALRDLTPGSASTPPGIDPRSLAGRTVSALQSAFQPIEGAGGASLTVTSLSEVELAALARLGVTRTAIEGLLAPVGGRTQEQAPAVGLVARGREGAEFVYDWVTDFAMPGDPPLGEWLAGRQGKAFLFLDAPEETSAATLVLAPGTEPVAIAAALSDARFDPYGPKGAAAVLTEAGTWESWRPAAQPPRLQEPLTLANFRDVAGNYASWSPLLFVGLLAGLVILSVLLALSFVVRTRGRNKR